MFCKKCGQILDDDSRFCISCGTYTDRKETNSNNNYGNSQNKLIGKSKFKIKDTLIGIIFALIFFGILAIFFVILIKTGLLDIADRIGQGGFTGIIKGFLILTVAIPMYITIKFFQLIVDIIKIDRGYMTTSEYVNNTIKKGVFGTLIFAVLLSILYSIVNQQVG